MSRSALLLLLLAPALAAQTPAEAPVRTLKDAYARALENSDSVAISEQALLQAEALYRGALGGAFPLISFRHNTDWQHRRVGGSQFGGAQQMQNEGGLRLTQVGLTGYREIAAVRGGKSVASRRYHERRRAEQLLLADVAGAWYGLLQSRENVSATARLLEYADKRLAETKDRVRVGRAREADALAQEVQSQGLRSQLVENERLVAARGDLLAFLVRAPVDPDAAEPAPSEPPALEGYLARMESRPDVAAAREAAAAASRAADAAFAGYLPQVTLTGNYYAYRPVARQSNKWDAALTASIPIFSFGAIRADNAAAGAAAASAGFSLRAARRAADLDARNAHRDYVAALRQLEIQRRAEELAQRDYRLQTQDERRGLVTSIEVLQSLDRLNVAGLARNDAFVQARLAAIALETAAGAMPGEILK
ncbi:MAG: TolC family protein [Elusimicrobiota bacterium]|nr:MAG: TolC family protein [Elusimicrobiota bacterium]